MKIFLGTGFLSSSENLDSESSFIICQYVKDLLLEKLAALGLEANDYCKMVEHIEMDHDLEHPDRDSELRRLRSRYEHLGIHHTEKGPLIVRDGVSILVPKPGRNNILEELHSTHLSKACKSCTEGDSFG